MNISLLKSLFDFRRGFKFDHKAVHRRRFTHKSSRFAEVAEVLEDRCLLSTFGVSNSIYRPSSNTIFVDHNFDGTPEEARVYGAPGDVYTSGDFNNDGLSDSAVLRGGTWFIDVTRDAGADFFIPFGQAGDVPLIGDADSNGLANLIVYRANGAWHVDGDGNGQLSSSSTFGGNAGDIPIIGDFNGDGRLDRGIYRPGEGNWHIDLGFDSSFDFTINFGGAAGDLPFVDDFNDDGFDDIGIFRNGILFISTTRSSNVSNTFFFGIAGDIPAPGQLNVKDVNHSLRPNFGIYRPSNGLIVHEFTLNSFSLPSRVYGGVDVDQPVVADFNGNTLTDTAIFRNGIWFIDFDRNASPDLTVIFGQAGDRAAAGDLNNDGFADLAIFRNGTWFIDFNRDGGADSVSSFGQAGDLPVIGDFNNDGLQDRGVYRPSTGDWFFDSALNGTVVATVNFGGNPADAPFAFDFNADGKTDIGVFRNGLWFIDTTRQGKVSMLVNFGAAGDVPIPGFFDPANSLFVRAGASGNGTEAAPFGSITQALNVIGSGGFVRVAPGNYVETPQIANKSNITIVGASRHFTTVRPNVGNALKVDFSSNIYLEELTFASQDAATLAGRGVVVFGSTLFGNGIRTTNNKNIGIYSAADNGQFSLVNIRNSALNLSQSGGGFFSEKNSIVQLTNVAADQNGTGSGTPALTRFGNGMVFLDATGTGSIATIRNSSGSFGAEHGLIAQGNVDLQIVNSKFDNNPNVNGGILNGQVSFEIIGTSFSNNGGNTARGPEGFNGLEIDTDSVSRKRVIRNSTFNNNSSYGIFVGGGVGINVTGSNFIGNFVGIFVSGINKGGFETGISTITILSSMFRSSSPSPSVNDEGITALGTGANVTIGGAGDLKNTFTDYLSTITPPLHSISSNGSGFPTMQAGSNLGMDFDAANIFINCRAEHFRQDAL